MKADKQEFVKSVVSVLEANYELQITELKKKLNNINYLNFDSLIIRIEKENPNFINTPNYNGIVSIIDSVLED